MSTGSQGEVDDIEEEIATAGPITRFATKIAEALWTVWRGWRAPKEEDDGRDV